MSQRLTDVYKRQLIMWEDCGMARTEESLTHAIERIPQLRKEFWENVRVTGTADGINAELDVYKRQSRSSAHDTGHTGRERTKKRPS